MPFTIIDGGSFASTGVAVRIPLPNNADYFVSNNVTQLAAAMPTACIKGEWFGTKFGTGVSAANDGLRWRKAASAAVLVDSFSTAAASDGFTYVAEVPFVEAANAAAITDIDQADPAVVTQANTFANDDILRFTGTTGQLQISGMPFQISTVTAADYRLIGLDSSGFAGAATAGTTRRISPFTAVNPEHMFITSVSQAASAVVRCSVNPATFYVVGMKVYFSIPQEFGMTELQGLTGTITAVTTADYTITVDINSTAFTAFAFPLTADAATSKRFAMLAPAGASTTFDPIALTETGYDFLNQPFRTSQFTPYLSLAGGINSPAGASGNIINWLAYKLEN